MEDKKVEAVEGGDSSRRDFMKTAAAGVALLPYVAPLVQSFTMTSAWAKKPGTKPPHGHGSPPPHGH